jgi:hypothetical protein
LHFKAAIHAFLFAAQQVLSHFSPTSQLMITFIFNIIRGMYVQVTSSLAGYLIQRSASSRTCRLLHPPKPQNPTGQLLPHKPYKPMLLVQQVVHGSQPAGASATAAAATAGCTATLVAAATATVQISSAALVQGSCCSTRSFCC